jgi:hypothetical protein
MIICKRVLGSPALALAALFCVSAVAACEPPKPDRIALDPAGPFRFTKRGESETVRPAAFIGKKPYVRKGDMNFKSSDPSVATVDENGVISATGSGDAVITAEVFGLQTTAAVNVVIVGSVEVAETLPKPFRLKHKPQQLKVVVKDDKGNVIDKPKVSFRATDYCVEVDDDGLVSPLADGDCDIIVSSADKSARLKLEVRE